jgi:hypothetical protein
VWAKLFVWSGGAMFVASLGLCAWWYTVFLGRVRPPAGSAPLAFDVALFTVFALHHSLFARDRVKGALAAFVPAPLVRSVFVWAASLLLIAVCLLWQPIGGEFYDDRGALAAAHLAVQFAGVWLIARSVGAIDALELAGIRAAADDPTEPALQTGGPYRLVRHPLYLGWMLIAFGAAHMTRDRFAFAAISSIYLVVAVPWEERSLRQSFGRAYEEYARTVRWRVIPFVY